MGTFTLLGFSQLVSTSLLKIDHGVITHLIAGAMLTQNPASKLNAKFLNHLHLPILSFKCKPKWSLVLATRIKEGAFSPNSVPAKMR
jgi:hypothetical protein